MTARELLDRLTAAGVTPAIEAGELVLSVGPPADLAAALGVMHTGVFAQLAGRVWWGCRGATGQITALDPGRRIPAGVTLLSVSGERGWDRIHPAARWDHPELFGGAEGVPVAARAAELVVD